MTTAVTVHQPFCIFDVHTAASTRINEQVNEFGRPTFVAVLYGEGSLGGFVVPYVAEAFTFSCKLVFDDHTILNIPILLQNRKQKESK